MARGPRGQVRIENATYRKLVAAMQPRFQKMASEIVGNRHSVIAVYNVALQPVRDSREEIRRIIDAERIQAARYGANRINKSVGARLVGTFEDPVNAMDSGPAVRMFIDRVYRDLARETHYREDESTEQSLDRIVARIARVLDSELLRLSRLNAAYGESFGAYASLREVGAAAKRWITLEDDDVRHSHEEVHGEVVPLEEVFSNGLLYPGDVMRGTPKDWMNCRCWIVPATREELIAA